MTAEEHMNRPHSSSMLAALAALTLTACTSDSATGPDEPGDGEPIVSAPALTNVPPIPIPDAPGSDVPAESAIHTTIARLDGNLDFNPTILRAFASWRVGESRFGGPWAHTGLGDRWSHQWASSLRTGSGLPAIPPPNPLSERILLLDGGVPVQSPRRTWVNGVLSYSQQLVMDARTFDGEVYVMRERQWELDSFDGGAFHLIASNQRVTLTESRTEGSSQTEIRTFGTTFTKGGGIDIAGLSANIEQTLTQTFSTSVTVTEQRTRQVSIDVAGEPGMLIDLRLWRLIDTYTLTDVHGNPLTHQHYVFDHSDGSMSWRTVAGTYPVQVKFRQ
jgi:hypothetical protein